MIPSNVEEALATLVAAARALPSVHEDMVGVWEGDRAVHGALPEALLQATLELDKALPDLARAPSTKAGLAPLFAEGRGEIVLAWCAAAVTRADVRLSPLLGQAAAVRSSRERAVEIARDRIVRGPLEDALACTPHVAAHSSLSSRENAEARARLEVLIWEAGATCTVVPEFGRLIWQNLDNFEALVARPAMSTLRGRVLAARCVELSVPAFTQMVDPELVGRALQALQPLVLHPEPLVFVPAARSLGLLAGHVEHLEAMLLDWLGGASPVLRERGMTAFACLPGARLRALRSEITGAVSHPDSAAWALRGAAAATPYLWTQAKDLWDDIFARILAGRGGSSAARELARGLNAVWRGGTKRAAVAAPLRELRVLARRKRPDNLQEWRDWLNVIVLTDPIDGAERDPIDVETGLENLVHLAAQYDDEEADARAARFAESIQHTFEVARRCSLGDGSMRARATGMNALEGCARSMALRLWRPQLVTHPRGAAVQEPILTETWETIARAPHELLDEVKARRENSEVPADPAALEEIEVLALRLGGYALDACGDDSELGPGGGPTAHATCRWLRKLDGVADGTRQLSAPLRLALSALFWRLVDTTRGTALGAVDDVQWLGPFAGWWALVIDRPAMLEQLAAALPMIREGALEKCVSLAEATRQILGSAGTNGVWDAAVRQKLSELHAGGTELAAALGTLGQALARMKDASGRDADLEARCRTLVVAAERVQASLADPVKGLHNAAPRELDAAGIEHTSKTAALITRAIRTRELSILDLWLTSLGPVASRLVEAQLQQARERTPPPPPARQKIQPEVVEGYELVRPLGEGGVGKVWLVRRPGADRLFVLKIPKSEALAAASEAERAGLLASFVEEAKALAGLYHPNVANIIDRGVSKGVPFLVLELLIGADLQKYSQARLLTLPELRPIVLDTCSGLASLHGAGLVHRDIKPANIWLRLPLEHGEKFDPQLHRDPARVRPLSAVVIDFGMVRPMKVPAEAAGRFVAGTPGYIAPDQVLDPVELDGRADVYALAASIFNVTTGRAFFDELQSPRERIFAHMQRDPLENPALLQDYPAALVKLMRSAVALDPKDRPQPMEFGRAFEAAL